MIDNNTKASIISTLREAKENYTFNSIVQSIKILNVSFIENTVVIKTEDNIIIFSDFLQLIKILNIYNIVIIKFQINHLQIFSFIIK